MSVILHPYVFFGGNAQEALDFYQSVFGGVADVSHYEDLPMPPDMEPMRGKIMHAQFNGDVTFMVSDTPWPDKLGKGQTNLSLSGDDEAKLKGYWDKLAESGEVTMPLEKQAWGDSFGMLTDKFGVDWMVNISPAK